MFFPLDISNSEEIDEISSIHSYGGNVADITTDELAYHELGETEEVKLFCKYQVNKISTKR